MAPEKFEFLSRAVAVRRGDILLVATDGLWKPHEISLAELVDSCGRHPLHLVQDWLTITRRNGSDDDQTAIAVVVG
jgi:serine/threonine protein phosphatase PrpC